MLAILCFLSGVVLCAGQHCPNGWTYYGESCYFFGNEQTTWINAKTICDTVHGRLVEIDTAEENNFLVDRMKQHSAQQLWIGLEDFVVEGNFVWASTQETPEYSNWSPGEPNDDQHREDCASLLVSGHWNDAQCEVSKYYFMCEMPVFPNGLAKPSGTTRRSVPQPLIKAKETRAQLGRSSLPASSVDPYYCVGPQNWARFNVPLPVGLSPSSTPLLSGKPRPARQETSHQSSCPLRRAQECSDVLVVFILLCTTTATLGSTKFVHETGEAKSSSYAKTEESGHASHVTYTRVSGTDEQPPPQVPPAHSSASAAVDTGSGLDASQNDLQTDQEVRTSGGHRNQQHGGQSANTLSKDKDESSERTQSSLASRTSTGSQSAGSASQDTRDTSSQTGSQSSAKTSTSSARTADRSATGRSRQSDESASAARRMSDLDRVSAMAANTEQRNYFRELFSRRCTDCVLNGETYRGHSRFEYDEGCSRFRCICSCDGSYDCPARYTINICKDGKVPDGASSSTETRQTYTSRRRCKQCQAYGQEFQGNAYFDVQDGCIKHRGCICYCNGTWTCPKERQINTCEGETTAGPTRTCRSCTAKGKVVEGNSYFELEELCKKYRYCRCRCDGSWECPEEYAEDTCKSRTTPAPVQDSVCQRCYANGKEVEGNTYFELTDGCIEYKNCVCRCNGSWTCPPQYARNTCQEQRGAVRNQSYAINTAECQSCMAYDKYFRGNTYFTIRNGCTRYSNCVCRCDGSWDCPDRYSTNVCTTGDGGGVTDDSDLTCSYCDARGKIIPSNSYFNFTEDCIQYSQCLCHCDGQWTCPEHYARNVCQLPEGGGLVDAEGDCGSCVMDSLVVRGNSRFSRVSDCYRYRDCLCNCDGSYECPPDRAENICQFNASDSSSSHSSASASASCRRCFAYGLFHAPGARFMHEEGCLEYECDCHCNGSYVCPPERVRDTCRTGCTQCKLDGQVYDGNTYFRRRHGCVEYTCTCFCNGTWDCPAERANRSGCTSEPRDSGATATDVSRSGQGSCSQCVAKDGQTHEPESDFVLTDGCIHYQCRCNCDGSWECPGETARNVCRGEELGGCRSCVISETQIYRGDEDFVMRDGCIHYSCHCNCDGSWECPGEKARDICLGEVPGGCRVCRVSENETYRGDSEFQLRQGCIHYQCNCHCNGSWECPGASARDVCSLTISTRTTPNQQFPLLAGQFPLGQLPSGQLPTGQLLSEQLRTGQFPARQLHPDTCQPDDSQLYNSHSDNSHPKIPTRKTPLRTTSNRTTPYSTSCNSKDSQPDNSHRDYYRPYQLDNSQPDNSQPNNSRPHNSHPDCYHQDNTQPDHSQLDNSHPENSHPDSSQPDVPGGCRVCKLDSGEIYRGESDFQLVKDCIHYKCRCSCDGGWNCPGEDARRICNADGSPLTQPALPRPQGQVDCRTCVVSDTEQFQGDQPFTLRRGCNEFQCECECDGSWNCPADRTRNVCDARPDPVLRAQTCRSCRVSSYVYPGSSSFLLTRGCKQYACRCDCNGRWSCNHTVARDICQEQDTATSGRQGTVVSSSGRTSATGFSSVSSTTSQQRAQSTIASTARQRAVSTARGRSVAETRLDSTSAVEQSGVTCRTCVVDGVERPPEENFIITKPCKRFTCFCACNGRWRCPRNQTEDLCPDGDKAKGTDSSSSSSRTSSTADSRQSSVGYQRRLEADKRRYSTDYRRRYYTDGRSRGSATTIYTQPVAGTGGSQRYGTANIRVVGAGTGSAPYTPGQQAGGASAGAYGQYNVRGYYVDGTQQPGTGSYYGVQTGTRQANVRTGQTGFGYADTSQASHSQYGQGQAYETSRDTDSSSSSGADATSRVSVATDTMATGGGNGDTCTPCQVDDKIYQTGAKFDWRRGCVVYKCSCLCSGSYRCRLSVDPECDQDEASAGTGGIPVGLPVGPSAGQPGGACGNCYVQGYVFPGNMSFTLRQGCEELSCRCACDGSHECLDRKPVPGCTAMSTPLAGAMYPYGSASAVYPIGSGGHAYGVRPVMPGRVINTFQQTYFTSGGGGPGSGVLVPVGVVPGQVPQQRQVIQPAAQPQPPAVSHSTTRREMVVPMRQVPVSDSARAASMEDKTCATCFANGRSYRGSFDYTKDCYHVTCYCDCEGKLRCSVQHAMSPACPAQYGPVSGRCRSCVVQGNEYPPRVQFALRVGCYGYDCTCGCDGLWMCPTQMPTNYCVRPASPALGVEGGGYDVLSADYRRTAELTDRTYSRSAEPTAELTEGAGTSCMECDVRGTTYPGRSKFFVRDGCLQHTCDCACDGSWACPKSSTVDICQEGQSEEKEEAREQQEVAEKEGQEMRQQHEDLTMSQRKRALAEVAAYQARLAARQSSCRSCKVDDSTYLPNADFQYRRNCYLYSCTCHCNGTFRCPLSDVRNLCAAADYSEDGCRECKMANKTYPGGAPFTYTEGCWEFNCQCGCNGQADCPPEQSRDLCRAGPSPGRSQADEDAGAVVAPGPAARCKPCVADGQVIRPRSAFTQRTGCTEFLCQCACNGTWTCPRDRSFNYCEQDGSSRQSSADLTAPPKKGKER
ncbi:hypothetical protein BaRGS_00028597 [Batillaria attramentaria]|uniref:C-type lectin domain-containing protein n=1 Tax=Batillaria attramentaria TaxID=370345 RepID=A0ABD0JZR7_9CAEN